MSFLGGAECSTAGNPLSQFTKHVQDDKSLQRDRLVNRGPSAGFNGFRNAAMNSPQQDEMVNNFLNQTPTLPGEMPLEHAHQTPFQFVRPDPAGQGVHLRAQSASPTWGGPEQSSHQSPMEAAFHAPPGTHFSADEFARFRQANGSAASTRASPMPSQAHQQQPAPMMGSGMGMMGMGGYGGMMGRSAFQPMYGGGQQSYTPQQQHQQGPDLKGKGKVVELDDHQWEEQFAQIELQDKALHDENLAAEPELNAMDEALHSETGMGDLESIWRGIQAEQAALRDLDEEDEFTKFDADTFSNLGGGWNSRVGPDPAVEEYLFESDNLFASQSDPFEEGLRIMSSGGNLSLAALAFEAAVQKDPSHVEAWVYLGSAQAQNEKEEAAIRALEHAMKLDPNNLSALMGLAVSYTNEGYDSTAYRTLERWLSVKYPSVLSPQDLSSAADLGFTDREQLHTRVTDLFIAAAQLSPDGEHMDPDVQVGLGVLFYGAEEYDKAVDCFTAALHSSELGASNRRDQLHLLWNRLGATLANSGRSEEAIAAYEKALSLNPNFVRARYNLGVSCINIGCHAEAAGHLLAALDMHKSVEKEGREKAREILGGAEGGVVTDERLDAMTMQNRSTTLYDTLRRVFSQMGRRDLAEQVVVGVDPDLFRGEFDF
ncbi:tetratricopeptide [Coniochaeta ligniaria NRRL 30616]|uniref:Peroxisomal targeting signal receptor n=1 Tax=Coniochaeta ligniaria NRRL 30616 TaxID=1408157 RepID=A0A1J7J624_9PEZI|nr:tetratricopeptide [Coniochaeta ligniaria NRRL 30616]